MKKFILVAIIATFVLGVKANITLPYTQDFSALTVGSLTSSTTQATSATAAALEGIATVTSAWQAGGVIKFGSASAVGGLTTEVVTTTTDSISVSFMAVAYPGSSPLPAVLHVTYDGVEKTVELPTIGKNFPITSADLVAYSLKFAAAGTPATVIITSYVVSLLSTTSRYFMDDLSITGFNAPVQCVPDVPLGLAVTPAGNSASLEWTAGGSGETEWVVEYKRTAADWSTATAVHANANTFVITGLALSTSYDVRVKSYCAESNQSAYTAPVSFTTTCIVNVFPYLEDFEGITTGVPACWTRYGFTTANSAITFPAALPTTTTTVGLAYSNSTAGGNGMSNIHLSYNLYSQNKYYWLFLPAVDLGSAPSNRQLTFEFSVGLFSTTSTPPTVNQKFMVLISEDGATWTRANATIWAHNTVADKDYDLSATGVIQEITIPLSQYTGSIKIAFYMESGPASSAGDLYVNIDNVQIADVPTCFKPTNLTVTNVMQHSFDLSWTPSAGGETEWIVEYRKSGATTWSSAHTASASYTLTGLAAMSVYEVKVKSYCNANDQSDPTVVIIVQTACTIDEFPWLEDFGTIATGVPTCWTRYGFITTNSAITFPTALPTSAAASGFSYTNSTNSYYGMPSGHLYYNLYGQNKYYWLFLPTVDLGAAPNNRQLTFDLFFGSSGTSVPSVNQKFMVLISEDNATWTRANATIWAHSSVADKDSVYSLAPIHEITIPLSQYTGNIKIAFYTESGPASSSGDTYISIDNVKIADVPTCFKPTNLTVTNVTQATADLNWTPAGSATEWIVEYRDASATAWTVVPAHITAADLPYTLTGLDDSSPFSVRVRAYCSPTDESENTNEVTFRTLCAAITALPWLENFDSEAAGAAPSCWTQSEPYGAYPRIYASTSDSHSPGNYVRFAGSTQQTIATPQFAAEANTLEVSFWLKRESLLNSGTFEVGVMSDAADISTYRQIQIVPISVADSYIHFEISLAGAEPGNHFIAFRQSNVTIGYYYYLDDVDVHSLLNCVKPTAVEVSNPGRDTVNISWTPGDAETAWNVIVSPTPVTDFGNVLPAYVHEALTNPYTVSGLSPGTEYYVYLQASCVTDESDWTMAVTFITLCSPITDLPWTDNFDAYASGSLPLCWVRSDQYALSGVMHPAVTNVASSSSDNSVYFVGQASGGSGSAGGVQIISTREFAAEANTLLVRFSLKRQDTYSGAFSVGVMSDPSDPTTFVSAQVISISGTAWTDFDIPLTGTPSGNHFIAFKHVPTTSFNGYWLDNVEIDVFPTCAHPTAVAVSSITQNTASITWTSPETNVTGWNVIVTPVAITDFSFIDPSITVHSVTAQPFTVTGLSASTSYYVYVQADCGTTDGTSIWAHNTFKTSCGVIAAEFWAESFDAASGVPSCWTQVETRIESGSLYPKVTSSEKHSANNSLEFNGPEIVNQTIATPRFVAKTNTMTVSFWLRRQDFNSSLFHIGVMTDPADLATYTFIEDVTPAQYETWVYVGPVSLASAPEDDHYIVFRQNGVTNNRYWLDDISLTAVIPIPPTVVTEDATNILQTTATLNATISEGSEPITSQGWYYRVQGSETWQLPSYTGNIGSLTANTVYEFYAFATTGTNILVNGDTLSFTTLANVPPTVVTVAANAITQTAATLNKTVSMGTQPIQSEGWGYKTQAGTSWTTVAGTNGALTGLTANTAYDFYAYAITVSGIFTGDTLSFTTMAHVAPTVTTVAASAIGQTTATLNKTVVPGTEAVSQEGFKYKKVADTSWTDVTATGSSTILTTLTLATDYEFYAYAITATDTYTGSTETFTTAGIDFVAPDVVTEAATAITQTTATLNKTVTPGSETVTTEGWQYKKVSDTDWIDVTDGNLTGLTANTAYEFYAYATTATGTFDGTTLTFNTLVNVPPTVETLDADPVGQTTATLNKNVVPGTEQVTEEGWYYRALGGTWTNVLDGDLTDLSIETEYEFYAYATTEGGTVEGDTLTFTTQSTGYNSADANEFVIYPNPANSMATVKVDGLNTSATVTVTDINGKLIETRIINAGKDSVELNVADYTDGAYLVRVVSDTINRVEKLIVKK